MTEPVLGNIVELTIDISLRLWPSMHWRRSSKTGEILAMASYPTYNLATFNQDYTTLNADEMRPLFNRALAAVPAQLGL